MVETKFRRIHKVIMLACASLVISMGGLPRTAMAARAEEVNKTLYSESGDGGKADSGNALTMTPGASWIRHRFTRAEKDTVNPVDGSEDTKNRSEKLKGKLKDRDVSHGELDFRLDGDVERDLRPSGCRDLVENSERYCYGDTDLDSLGAARYGRTSVYIGVKDLSRPNTFNLDGKATGSNRDDEGYYTSTSENRANTVGNFAKHVKVTLGVRRRDAWLIADQSLDTWIRSEESKHNTEVVGR